MCENFIGYVRDGVVLMSAKFDGWRMRDDNEPVSVTRNERWLSLWGFSGIRDSLPMRMLCWFADTITIRRQGLIDREWLEWMNTQDVAK